MWNDLFGKDWCVVVCWWTVAFFSAYLSNCPTRFWLSDDFVGMISKEHNHRVVCFPPVFVALRFEGGRGDGDGKGMEWLEHIETSNESICSLAGRELWFGYGILLHLPNMANPEWNMYIKWPQYFPKPRFLLRGNLNRSNWQWWCYVPSTYIYCVS